MDLHSASGRSMCPVLLSQLARVMIGREDPKWVHHFYSQHVDPCESEQVDSTNTTNRWEGSRVEFAVARSGKRSGRTPGHMVLVTDFPVGVSACFSAASLRERTLDLTAWTKLDKLDNGRLRSIMIEY